MAKEKQKFEVCKKCNQEIKPIQLAPKKRIAWSCDCGIFEKNGNKIREW